MRARTRSTSPGWLASACLLVAALAGAPGGVPAALGLTFAEFGDAPALVPGVPTVAAGPLTLIYGALADSADVDLYRIQVADPGGFSATVVGGAGFDTQLFLFDGGGTGITHDDDAPPGDLLQSTITGAFLPGPGTYYIAISAFDRDPTNAAANLIWLQDPVNVERSPDGAPGPLGGWTGFGNSQGGEYWIRLTGCAAFGPGPQPGVWQEAGDAAAIYPGQATSGAGSLLRIFGSLGDSIDVDLYRIRITDPGSFSATTAGDVEEDTQLFLFDAAGNGVAFNDDQPDVSTALSRLSGTFVSAGTYYLGISEFSRNPISAGGYIWAEDPAYAERSPDGPGATGPLLGWSRVASSAGGYYGVVLTGAQFGLGNTDVESGRSPDASVRLEAYPNPSHGGSTITYRLPGAGPVRLEILDMHGRLVRTLLDEPRAEPSKSLQWDGRDARGAAVATGVYIVRLEAGGASRSRRVVWVGDR